MQAKKITRFAARGPDPIEKIFAAISPNDRPALPPALGLAGDWLGVGWGLGWDWVMFGWGWSGDWVGIGWGWLGIGWRLGVNLGRDWVWIGRC